MAGRGAALADQFEKSLGELTQTIQSMPDDKWQGQCEEGWTVALAALPQTSGRAAPLARARAARRKDLPQVGILDSSRYASLHPGYWIVFSGVYSSEAEATSALEDARRASRTAVVRHVVP